MIQKIENIPITDVSYPVTRAANLCGFAERGYVEEEYFMYGTANVYGMQDGACGFAGEAVIRFADAPYVNRFLVRRPADISKASGRVAIEILNATSGVDIDRTWVLCKEQMMREGDVYIGITSKPSSLRPLHKADPERYKALYWSNPNPAKLPLSIIAESANGGALEQGSEMGLFWDMLTDLHVRIREGAQFLGGIEPKYVYLIGWSQSCGYIIRYMNTFVNTGKAPQFDGCFVAGGVRRKTPPLNQYEAGSMPREPGNNIEKASVPYIMMQTESENAAMNNVDALVEDSDDPEFMVRTYEVPGATHDSQYTMLDYFGDRKDEYRIGIILDYPGEEPYPNDYPYEFAFSAAYAQMCRWAEKKIPAIHTPKIPLNLRNENIRDQFGNAVGGWRLPPIEHPACTYFPYCTPINQGGIPGLFGCRHPFEDGKLQEMYGTLAKYEELIAASADKCIEEGTLLAGDRQACIDYCVKEAKLFGLE